ncbi:MAG: M15 family metallopeptidase [Bacteroidetes bacterium]|jgi:D-alanyl-D-alanine dipeptidase|nr:M15 family metallopeptidase [Bacteroidota bacterium]MBP8917207.1 M15 family metallopeptidase [Chitinophagales bacterium]
MKWNCISILLFFTVGCSSQNKDKPKDIEVKEVSETKSISPLEQQMISAGLINVQEKEPGILVELKYSSTDNFLNTDVYGELENAYLQPDVLIKLQKAYQYLIDKDSTLTFIIYDATRPVSVQQKMWDIVQENYPEKSKYVSNPKNGSLHNYGAAVDITVATKNGVALDMGTPYDFFGEAAEPQLENILLANGTLSELQIQNRKILREVMVKAGFVQLPSEWWHYNSCSREQAKVLYTILE